jgi:hypothetical protein
VVCLFFSKGDRDDNEELEPKWLPLPLRTYFWLPFVVVLALGAIGLEIALHFSNTKQGVFQKFCRSFFLFFFFNEDLPQDGRRAATLAMRRMRCIMLM